MMTLLDVPPDLKVIPSVVLAFIAISEILRKRKSEEPIFDSKAPFYALILLFVCMFLANLAHFVFPDLKDTIKAVIAWISILSAFIALPSYLWNFPIKWKSKRDS